MKLPPPVRLVFGSSILAAVSGCAAPDTANLKKNSDNVAQMRNEAKEYENKDGNLNAGYVLDRLLDGGNRTNKPVFDQPRGNDGSR